MSLVYITCHDERITDIEKRLAKNTPESIKRRYAQRICSKIKRPRPVEPNNLLRDPDGKIHINTSNKYEHKTFGIAPQPFNYQAQCNFLRKQQGVRWLREPLHKCPKRAPMPPLPRYKKGDSNKQQPNIIERNRECIKKANVKKPTPRYVDTAQGARHELINSGLIPQHICSKYFAKVPPYIKVFKRQFEELRQHCWEEEKRRQEKCLKLGAEDSREMTAEERKQLLAGLETNFIDLTRQYQSMSLIVDTLAKQTRKGRIEKALTELENNIKLLKEHPTIYIIPNY